MNISSPFSLPFELKHSGHPPCAFDVTNGRLRITGDKSSNLFVDPIGPVEHLPDAGRLTGPSPRHDFTLAAKVSVELSSVYDAGALLLYSSPHRWAKLCLEYSPQLRPTLVSVVTREFSDDCNSFEIESNSYWLRITQKAGTWAFHASADGAWWRLLRYFRLDTNGDFADVEIGFLAQSPRGRGCTTEFSHVTFNSGAPADLRNGK